MSGDPEQEYFSDGITEDIITEISKFRSLFVTARQSSFTYKGRATPIPIIAKELGVKFLLEGSVRTINNRVRITAQLVDGSNGTQVWAQRYDRELEDVFAIQDEVTQSIVGTVAGRVDAATIDHRRCKTPQSLTAYDWALRGLHEYNQHNLRDHRATYSFEKAVALDPEYARAKAYLALSLFTEAFYLMTPKPDFDRALTLGNQAVALDDEDSLAHAAIGLAQFMRRRDQEAVVKLERALVLNPNDAEVEHWFGFILVYLGRHREAVEHIRTAIRLNPFQNQYYNGLGMGLYLDGQYEDALDALMRIRQSRMSARWNIAYQAASYGQLGRTREARELAKEFVCLRRAEIEESGEEPPTNTLALADAELDFFRSTADADHFVDGLRKAGLSS